MQYLYSIVLVTTVIMSGYPVNNTGMEDCSVKIKNSDKTIQLFDNESLNGWYTFIRNRGRNIDPKGVFTVLDGMIRISGEEWGSLTTIDEFENYHLIVEFKWGDKTFEPRLNKARDSGLLVHSKGEDGGYQGIWMHSIECQIIEGGTGDIIVVGDGTPYFSVTAPVADLRQGNSFVYKPEGKQETIHSGRINWFGRDDNWKDTLNFRGINDIEKPAGEWNILECIANGEQFSILLNGVVVNKALKVTPKEGRIQIQSEGAEIFFRKVELIHL